MRHAALCRPPVQGAHANAEEGRSFPRGHPLALLRSVGWSSPLGRREPISLPPGHSSAHLDREARLHHRDCITTIEQGAGPRKAPRSKNPTLTERGVVTAKTPEWFRPLPCEWLDEPPPPREYLLTRGDHGFLPSGIVGLVVGAGGISKSQLMTQLAIDVAAGREWLDTCDSGAGGHVLLGMAEEDENEMRRRIAAYVESLNPCAELRSRILSRLVVAPWGDYYSPSLAYSFEELRALYPDRQDLANRLRRSQPYETPLYSELWSTLRQADREWRLIVLDPASQLGPSGFESDATVARRFIRMLLTLTALPGRPTVLLVHHSNKASRSGSTDATAARGTSALPDSARWQLNVEALTPKHDPTDTRAGLIQVKGTKSNYTALSEPIKLARGSEGVIRLATEGELAALDAKDADEEGAPEAGLPARRKRRSGRSTAASADLEDIFEHL